MSLLCVSIDKNDRQSCIKCVTEEVVFAMNASNRRIFLKDEPISFKAVCFDRIKMMNIVFPKDSWIKLYILLNFAISTDS